MRNYFSNFKNHTIKSTKNINYTNEITAIVITLNEEKNIGRCLESLKSIVAEIIVVDSFSTDKTKEICEYHKVHFIEHAFEGYIQQKNYAISLANTPWVLGLDADEALSEELRNSLLRIESSDEVAYAFNRRTNYCGQWIKHCGWYPDRKIRLWKKDAGQWGGQNPHDRVILIGDVVYKHLAGDLLHYSYHTIESHIDQTNKFSTIGANEKYKKGKKSKILLHMLIYPFWTFIKNYFFKLGILDGYFGFVICVNSSYYKYLKYVKLYTLRNK